MHHLRWKPIDSYACPMCGAELWGYYEWETERWLVVHGEPDMDHRPGEEHIVVWDMKNKLLLDQDEQKAEVDRWCQELHDYWRTSDGDEGG